MQIPICLAIFQTFPENMRCINNTWYLKGNIKTVANLTHKSEEWPFTSLYNPLHKVIWDNQSTLHFLKIPIAYKWWAKKNLI